MGILRSLLWVFVLVICFPMSGLCQGPALISFEEVLLTQEPGGWRVSILPQSVTKSPFREGDLLKEVDGRDDSRLGALAMAAFMSSALSRALPVMLQRDNRPETVTFYRPAGDVPAYKALTKPLRVVLGAAAPEFEFPDLTGKPVHLSEFRGQWVLLNFWATWCGPCVEEMPALKGLAAANKQNLRIIGIAMSQDASQIQAEHSKVLTFVERIKPGYIIVEGGDFSGQMVHDYGENNGMGSATIPYSILIRPNGTVAYVQCDGSDPSNLVRQVTALIHAQ